MVATMPSAVSSEPRTQAEIFASELVRREPDTTRWGRREDGSVASFLAETGTAWLKKSSSARELDKGPGAPAGPTDELHCRHLAQFADGSVAAVFDNRVETGFGPAHIVRDHESRYAGMWDGESLSVLTNILERTGDRYPSLSSSELFSSMSIPHQSEELLANVPGDARDLVLAADKNGNILSFVGPELIAASADPDSAERQAGAIERRQLLVAEYLGQSGESAQASLAGVQSQSNFLQYLAAQMRGAVDGARDALLSQQHSQMAPS